MNLPGEVIRTIEVRGTQEYDAFDFFEDNRQVKINAQFRDLLESIKENGLISPIIVKPHNGKLFIADGQHRFIILKQLGLPVEYYVNDNIDLSAIISANATTIKHSSGGFLGIGQRYGIKFFDIVMDIIAKNPVRVKGEESNGCEIPYTAALEIVGTFLLKNKESIYNNTQFSKGCKINLKKTLSEMDVKITPKQEKEIDDFINLAKDIVMAIDKDSLKVNFNRELLKVHLGIGSDTPHITLKELLAYLKKEKYKESSCKNRMRLSSSDKEFRRIIQEIADKLEAKKNKRKTKVSTKAA